MTLFDVLDDGTAEPADDRPPYDHIGPMCVWCGQFVAETRGWCSTCLDREVR